MREYFRQLQYSERVLQTIFTETISVGLRPLFRQIEERGSYITAGFRVMVVFDCSDISLRHAPMPQDVGAGLTMGRAENKQLGY